MSRHLVALTMTLFLGTAWPVAAQDSGVVMSEPSAQRLLASSDPKEQAWGAWMAGRLLMTDATPQIERVIRSVNISEQWKLVAVCLDALIEIGATTNAQLLEATRKRFPVQSVLLVKPDIEGDRFLLAMMSAATSYEWFAAANKLYARRAPGFAALLLKDLELGAEVVVSATDGTLVGEGGGSFSIGDTFGGLAEGYPPIAAYEFRSCGRPGVSMLADGPHEVCYQKARPPAGQFAALSSHGDDKPTVADRLKYFASDWFPLEVRDVYSRGIVWTSDAETQRQLAELVKFINVRYAEAITKLRDTGWLTPAEAAGLARPKIRERIRDLRYQQ